VTPIELISIIEQRGGFVGLALSGDKLRVRLPRDEAERIKVALRAIKPAIVALLRQRTVVHLDVPCTCDEQPYPHFRHHEAMTDHRRLARGTGGHPTV
jgi:hypothetical protein